MLVPFRWYVRWFGSVIRMACASPMLIFHHCVRCSRSFSLSRSESIVRFRRINKFIDQYIQWLSITSAIYNLFFFVFAVHNTLRDVFCLPYRVRYLPIANLNGFIWQNLIGMSRESVEHKRDGVLEMCEIYFFYGYCCYTFVVIVLRK